jgi:hypothetical protein
MTPFPLHNLPPGDRKEKNKKQKLSGLKQLPIKMIYTDRLITQEPSALVVSTKKLTQK